MPEKNETSAPKRKAPAKTAKPAKAAKPVDEAKTAKLVDETEPVKDTKSADHHTVPEDTTYENVATKFQYNDWRELAAINGVSNSRYEIAAGTTIYLPPKHIPTLDN